MSMPDGVMIFQQKPLNEQYRDNADEHYCRVLINYNKSTDGDMLHCWETSVIDGETREMLLEAVMQNLYGPQQLLAYPTIDWLDIGDAKALRVRYRRTGNNGNTTACAMYYLFNSDEVAMVMTAYREQEAHLWQSDMENVVRTFRWRERK